MKLLVIFSISILVIFMIVCVLANYAFDDDDNDMYWNDSQK